MPPAKLGRISYAELHRHRLMDRFAIDCLLVTCYSLSVPSVLLSVCFWLMSLYPLFSWDSNLAPLSLSKILYCPIWERIRRVAFNFYPFISRILQIPGQLPHDPSTSNCSLSLPLSPIFFFFFLPLYLYTLLFRGMRGIIA